MQMDEILKDIPYDVTLEEVQSKIAVEYGQSITITLLRDHKKPLEIIIPQTATVYQLKKAIKRHFETFQRRAKYHERVNISWRYIWRTYELECDGNVLIDDGKTIVFYGVVNKSKLKFVEKHRRMRRTK